MNLLHDSNVPRALLRALLCIVILTAIFSGVGTVYASHYTDRIYPGVHVGPISVGGMTHEQAAALLSSITNNILEIGLAVSIEGHSTRIALLSQAINDPDASTPLVSWDIDAAVRSALTVGRGASLLVNMLSPLAVRLTSPTIAFPPSLNQSQLESAVRNAFPQYNTPPVNAGFIISESVHGWNVTVTQDKGGTVMDTGKLFSKLDELLKTQLTLLPIELSVHEQAANISKADAQALIPNIEAALTAAPYTIQYATMTGYESWELSAPLLATGLEVRKKDNVNTIGFTDTFAETFFEPIATQVNVAAQDARFAFENGRVKEFQGNHDGVEVDVSATRVELETMLGHTEYPVELVVNETKPSVAIGDINDLGIKEVLGIGTSNFAGSPANRIRNIKNGATLLNGILIAPDETFSLLFALRPFTTDNGYYPELVIKGDKIQPEVGGGLCQIGTTTFRAAMASGLPIVERRNHSLVVRYYHDARNNNPGTDATIYDPAPDFKFQNDTGHSILFATDMNETTGILTFTFWGTSDGRHGSYSAPEVSSWIAPGEKQIIETTDLAVGVEQCQHAFVGANASFTYTVTKVDGTSQNQVFTSSYRPLPEICLVGVASLSAVEGNQTQTPSP